MNKSSIFLNKSKIRELREKLQSKEYKEHALRSIAEQLVCLIFKFY